MNCVNCGYPVDSKFCPNCGQKTEVKPLSLSYLWMDFQSRIYGFDSVFPRTIKELTTRPGAVVERFIKGNRIVYVGPVGYFFLMVAISVLLMDLTGLDFFEFSKTVTPISGEITSKQEQVSKLMSGYVAENFRLFKFLLIPVNTFWIWLFIRKKGYNYIKSSVAAFYAQGQLELFYMINIVTLYFFDWHFYQFVFLLEPAYYGFIFITWMSGNKIKSFLKGALVWTLTYVAYMVIVVIAGVVWIVNHPELIQSLKP